MHFKYKIGVIKMNNATSLKVSAYKIAISLKCHCFYALLLYWNVISAYFSLLHFVVLGFLIFHTFIYFRAVVGFFIEIAFSETLLIIVSVSYLTQIFETR